MAQRGEGGEVNSDEGRVGHSDHRGGGGSKGGGVDDEGLSTGGDESADKGDESADKARTVKGEVGKERPREEGKKRSGGDVEVGDSRQTRAVLSKDVQQTSEDARRTEAEVSGGRGGWPEGKAGKEGVAHAGGESVSQKGGRVDDLEKGVFSSLAKGLTQITGDRGKKGCEGDVSVSRGRGLTRDTGAGARRLSADQRMAMEAMAMPGFQALAPRSKRGGEEFYSRRANEIRKSKKSQTADAGRFFSRTSGDKGDEGPVKEEDSRKRVGDDQVEDKGGEEDAESQDEVPAEVGEVRSSSSALLDLLHSHFGGDVEAFRSLVSNMGGGGKTGPESDAEIAIRLGGEERARVLSEQQQLEASAKLAREMESTFQAADKYVSPSKNALESSCEGDESSQLVFSNSETVSGQSVLEGNRFESLVDDSEDDQFPPLPSVPRVTNPWQVVGQRGSKKKRMAPPSELSFTSQMVILSEKNLEVKRKAFEGSKSELGEIRVQFDKLKETVSVLARKWERAKQDPELERLNTDITKMAQKEEEANKRIKAAEKKRLYYEQEVEKEKSNLARAKTDRINLQKRADLTRAKGGAGVKASLDKSQDELARLRDKFGAVNLKNLQCRKEAETAASAVRTAKEAAGVESLPEPDTPVEQTKAKKAQPQPSKKGGGEKGKREESRKGGDSKVEEKGVPQSKGYTIPKIVPPTQEDSVYEQIRAKYPGLDGKALADEV